MVFHSKHISLVLEQAPVMLFVTAKYFDVDIQHRINIGAVAALAFFGLLIFRQRRVSPLFLGVNLFFFIVATVQILPLQRLENFLLALGEAGMFVVILVSALMFFFADLKYSAQENASQERKIRSLIFLLASSVTPPFAYHFRGNEDVAGALPFIFLMLIEKFLGFLKLRESNRKDDDQSNSR